MHDVVLVENLEGLEQLLINKQSLLFWKHTLLFEHTFQSTAVAIFVDKVEIVRSFEHVNVLDDVFMLFDVGQDINLVYSTLLEFFVFLKSAHFDHFYCVLFGVQLVSRPVHFAVSPFADDLVKRVVFDDSNHFGN